MLITVVIVAVAVGCALGFLFGALLSTTMLILISIASVIFMWLVITLVPNEVGAAFIKILSLITLVFCNVLMWITPHLVHKQNWISDFIRTYVLR